MPTPKELYVQQLDAIAKRFASVDAQVSRRSLTLLQELRRQIAAEVLIAGTDFEQFRLAQMSANIDKLVADFERQLLVDVQTATQTAIEMGSATITEPLQVIGVEGAFFQVSPAQVNTLLDFSAELVKDIGTGLKSAINVQVRNAALGQTTPFHAMKNITDKMGLAGVRTGKDVTTGVAARAETVLRTELQRVFNVSSHAQQQATAKQVPGLLKRWIATSDSRTRKGHLRIHNETRVKPIPIDKPFIVYDIDAKGRVKGKAELMYPLDPSAPPQYTINCRCRQATIHPEIGVIGSSLDGRIAAELERRE